MLLSTRPSMRPAMRTKICASATLTELPASTKKATAVLNGPNGSRVFVLGISHVSKVDISRIRDLISAVRPDAVLVELCKDRSNLLIDPAVKPMEPTQLWHLQGVELAGFVGGEGYPKASELLALTGISTGAPVSRNDMEAGAVSLLSTGLFKSCTVGCSAAPVNTPPVFVPKTGGAAPAASAGASFRLGEGTLSGAAQDENLGLSTLLPLGTLTYTVTSRALPRPTAVTIEGSSLAADRVAELNKQAVQRASLITVQGLMWLRAQILAAEGPGTSVVFEGVETGQITVSVSKGPAGLTGLEVTAKQGKGVGIENSYAVGPRQAGASRASVGGGAAAPAAAQVALAGPRPDSGAAPTIPGVSPPAIALAKALTVPYSKAQAQAGKTVGVQPGAAWRAAFDAAAAAGGSLVLLGDRPTDVTRVRLANSIFNNMTGRWAAGFVLAVAAAALANRGLLPPGTELPAVAGSLGLLALIGVVPVVAPLAEVNAFAGKSAKEVEDIVEIKDQIDADVSKLLKVWGEDALLDFPGAVQPVIDERDRYMAECLRKLASGGTSVAPAYVKQQDGSWRYAVSKDGPAGANLVGSTAPPSYELKGPFRTVVAVVGTAHVRGIVKGWGESANVEELV